jgi:hypothetical protein
MFVFFLLAAAIMVAVVAQEKLDSDQYTALRTFLSTLGCTAPRCEFAAVDTCPVVRGADRIVCDGGRVVEIELLGSPPLTGSIDASSVGQLTDLSLLQLIGHVLTTTLPSQIGRLTALTQLTVANSSVTGSLPSRVANLRNLRVLSVRTNRLSGSLPALETLTKLTALLLYANEWTGPLPALDKLTRLTALDASNNRGLGGTLPPMPTSLKKLNLDNCSFTALPPNLSALTNLDFLDVQRNKLTGAVPVLPANIRGCYLQWGTIGEVVGPHANPDESNCLACPSNSVSVGGCVCRPQAADALVKCPSLATTMTTSSDASTVTMLHVLSLLLLLINFTDV